jgi:hypothetical protein
LRKKVRRQTENTVNERKANSPKAKPLSENRKVNRPDPAWTCRRLITYAVGLGWVSLPRYSEDDDGQEE